MKKFLIKNKPKKYSLWNKLKNTFNDISVYEDFLNIGKVISVSDGVAKVSGLMGVRSG